MTNYSNDRELMKSLKKKTTKHKGFKPKQDILFILLLFFFFVLRKRESKQDKENGNAATVTSDQVF